MSTIQHNLATAFYWIGVALALACLAFIAAGNTEFFWRFEHAGLPLSWAFAGAAIIAFAAFEFCDYSSSVPSEAEDRSSPISLEWEAFEL